MAPTAYVKRQLEEILDEDSIELSAKIQTFEESRKLEIPHSFRWNEVRWINGVLLSVFHLLALYAAYSFVTGHMQLKSIIGFYIFGAMSGFGITTGVHRLWSHRAYKAKWPLRVLLICFNCIALQNDIYDWCRNHRVHHKYSDTNADPHNSNRGWFFAHMGWLMLKKHPLVTEKGSQIDLSDVLADPLIRFQRRYYLPLTLLWWGLIPTVSTMYLFNETAWNSFLLNVCLRTVYILHVTWNVNSSAHIFGNKPYNVAIQPKENKAISYITYGEGYHNYHHTFPFDYSTSEFGASSNFNMNTLFIDLFASIGWAYDLKELKPESIQSRIDKSGDHTHIDKKKWTKMDTLLDWTLGFFTSGLVFIILMVLRLVVTCC